LTEVNNLKKNYAFQACDSQAVYINASNQLKNKTIIEAIRITGRPESKLQNLAPWDYGDNFNLENVPSIFLKIGKKIEQCNKLNKGIKLSNLRDITINFRANGMFKLDPHIDPPLDGSQIFVLGLKSDVVFTLTPSIENLSENMEQIQKYNFKLPLKIRTAEDAIALKSWTDEDIDIFLKKNSLLKIENDARYKWKHAIRTGVFVDDYNNNNNTHNNDDNFYNININNNNNDNNNSQTNEKKNNNKNSAIDKNEEKKIEKKQKIYDWHGNLESLKQRNDERISIIFAFL
jgi:hypothetical protein